MYDRSQRRKVSSPYWAELHSSILESIFQCLSFQDALKAESVCSNWRSSAKALIASKAIHSHSHHTQLLMLPPDEEEEYETTTARSGYSCLNLGDKDRVYEFKNVPKELMSSCCVGSSHGWLVFLDESAAPFLLNPCLQVRLQLPSVNSLLDVQEIVKTEECDEYVIKYYGDNHNQYMKNLRERFISKCILTSDPCVRKNNFGLVLIYGYESKLGYYKYGDSNSWIDLEGKNQPYRDVICSENQLYALGSRLHDTTSFEVWDLDDKPIKKMCIELPYPNKTLETWRKFGDRYVSRCYLVKIMGEVMLVVRYIGEFVNEDDEVIYEQDLLTNYSTQPLVCPYKTLMFHVYKLDFDKNMWVEVENIGDHSVFLGGNQSISSSGCEKNSIYFTDDYWERMNEDYLYGGHDMGVFSLKDGSVKSFYERSSFKIQPPPCWITLNP